MSRSYASNTDLKERSQVDIWGDRRVTISYMMNKMAPGIIGSDRSESYLRALESCL